MTLGLWTRPGHRRPADAGEDRADLGETRLLPAARSSAVRLFKLPAVRCSRRKRAVRALVGGLARPLRFVYDASSSAPRGPGDAAVPFDTGHGGRAGSAWPSPPPGISSGCGFEQDWRAVAMPSPSPEVRSIARTTPTAARRSSPRSRSTGTRPAIVGRTRPGAAPGHPVEATRHRGRREPESARVPEQRVESAVDGRSRGFADGARHGAHVPCTLGPDPRDLAGTTPTPALAQLVSPCTRPSRSASGTADACRPTPSGTSPPRAATPGATTPAGTRSNIDPSYASHTVNVTTGRRPRSSTGRSAFPLFYIGFSSGSDSKGDGRFGHADLRREHVEWVLGLPHAVHRLAAPTCSELELYVPQRRRPQALVRRSTWTRSPAAFSDRQRSPRPPQEPSRDVGFDARDPEESLGACSARNYRGACSCSAAIAAAGCAAHDAGEPGLGRRRVRRCPPAPTRAHPGLARRCSGDAGKRTRRGCDAAAVLRRGT